MTMKKDKKIRIAVDIDNTITEEESFGDIWKISPEDLLYKYSKAKPNKKAIKIVNKLYEKDYIVFLYSSRNDLYQRITKKWLDKNNVMYHYFLMNKPYYDFLLDDKAINLQDIISGKCAKLNI